VGSFVSRESNRIIFSGAELQADFKPGGLLAGWARDPMASHDLRPREGPAVEPKSLSVHLRNGQNDKASRATIELVPRPKPPK